MLCHSSEERQRSQGKGFYRLFETNDWRSALDPQATTKQDLYTGEKTLRCLVASECARLVRSIVSYPGQQMGNHKRLTTGKNGRGEAEVA